MGKIHWSSLYVRKNFAQKAMEKRKKEGYKISGVYKTREGMYFFVYEERGTRKGWHGERKRHGIAARRGRRK